MSNLGRRAVVGSLSTAGGNLGGFLLRFAVNAVLARTILPDDYGAYGFAVIYALFVNLLQSFSFQQALLQLGDMPGLFETTRRYALGLAAAGALVGLLMFPIVAAVHSLVVAECFLGLVVVQAIATYSGSYELLLYRSFRFNLIAALRIVSVGVSLCVALPIGLAHPGPFVLVIRDGVPPIISLGVVGWVVRRQRLAHQPGVDGPYNRETGRAVWKLGKDIALTRAFEAFFQRVDSMVVGAALGEKMLGYYDQARYLAGLPTAAVAPFGLTVGLRTFAAVRDDRPRLTRAFELTQWAIAHFAAVFSLGAIVAPDLAIFVIYGPTWAPSAELLRFLSLWIIAAPLAINQQMLLTAVTAWSSIRVGYLIAAGVVAALAFPLNLLIGPPGVALAASLGYAASALWFLGRARAWVTVPVRALAPVLLAIILAAAVALVARAWLLPPGALNAVLGALVGLVSFALALLVLERKKLTSELRYLRDVIRRRGS